MSEQFNDDAGFETDIAVVGMAGRFAGARNIAEYWHNLRNGIESISTFSEEELLAAGVDPAHLADPNYVRSGAVMPDMEQFDAGFFGLNNREASIMDPQHRHFLECAWEALENAGHMPETFQGSIGVFGGSGHNAYMPYNLLTNPKLVSSVGLFLLRHTGNDKDFLTTRVSYTLNLKGPSVNVQTACSTSLVAIHSGVQSLLNRECDMALAGGVTIELPHRQGYIYQEGEILSPDGHCHAFDADSQGTVFGSGAGVVALRRLADALADGDHIHAVIKGSAINNDGSGKVGYLAPSVDGQAQAIAEALAIANVSPETITYIEAHGTGTPVGDPIEIAALTQAFRQGGADANGFCGIGSVKSNIGHTDTAAGVASFLKVAMAMQHRELPPSLHFKSPNPACEFERSPFYVNATLKPWVPPAGTPRRAGVSSLGVGGTNAHIILEEAPKQQPSGPSRPFQLIVQSAKTLTALDAGSATLAGHFAQHPAQNFADASHTLQVGRQAMKHRRVVVAKDAADAAAALQAKDPKRVFTETAEDGTPRSVAFMFAGGGAQYPNMGADLYRSEPVFKAAVDECLRILETQVKTDIRPLLFPAPGQEEAAATQLERPSLALPALLTVQYAQAKLWMSWGLTPTAMIGHSMGEYTAAHLAGVFSLADALTLVELRGRLFETLPEGGMLSVPMSEEDLKPYMTPELSFSVINGPKLTVVGGPVAAIEALQQRLAEQEIEAARVRINVAAHSSMLEPILKAFGDFLNRISMKAPALPFVSNLSGTWITPAEATDPQYWVRHLRNTVRFADGLSELLKDPTRILLEVGPGRTLSSLARQHPARSPQQGVINSLRHPDEQVDDQAFVLTTLGRLWGMGAAVDWAKLRGNERRLRVELPTYRFDHARHWIEPGKGASALAPSERSLHKRKDVGDWFYQPVWKRVAMPLLPVQEVSAEPANPVTVLVFADTLGFADRLCKRLRIEGLDVVTVKAGKTYYREGKDAFLVNPKSGPDHDKVFATLMSSGRTPQRIYHLWTLTGNAKPPVGLAAVGELQQLGFYNLLTLAQSMGREDLADPVRIAVVTDHLQRVSTETGLVPAKATLLGPCKVIPCEFTNMRCESVDIEIPAPDSRQEALLLDGLVAELATPHADDTVAYRAGQRWVQDYEPAQTPKLDGVTKRLRQHGVYLITGGLGGVGLALAEHLAATVKAKLVLVGRTALPPRAEWPQALALADAQPALARRIRQVMALEALGAEVMVVAADVTDLGQMKTAVKQAQAKFGPIHGVLHTAGVLNDGVIQLKETAVAASVLAPKLQGTLVLEGALAGQPLDFLVLFSSISSFAGLAGQVDYAAANAFLDAYAQERFTRDATYTVAVNWSQWQEVGMAAELAHQLGLSGDALAGVEGVEVGHPLVERCLQDTPAERVYGTRFSVAKHWLLDEHRVLGGNALIPGTGYLELVRAAFMHKPQPKVVELRNVTFLSPFAVRDDEEKDLRIHIRSHGGAASPFSVVSRSAGDAGTDQPWTENVRGSVAYVDEPRPQAEAAAQVLARCNVRSVVYTGDEKQTHLLFGPRWSNIQRIDYGQGEALATLELPAAFAGDLAQIQLHPALMDMATGGAQTLVPGYDESRDFFVPASYGRLRFFGPLTARLHSHIRYRADESGSDDLAYYDVTITNDAGEVVVDVHDFTMIRVRDKALLARSEAATPARTPAQAPAKPRATANNILAVGMRDGILSDEGAEVLERVLEWGAGPQMVVSPQDLIALLAQLRAPAQAAAEAGSGAAEGAVGEDWKAPTTATEKIIAQMWGDMLGVERVSASANFFDLGGHSLLAVQVINKLKKKTGKALPLTALLEAPTVETLAAMIEPPGSRDAASDDAGSATTAAPVIPRSGTLIPIRTGGDKLPVFMVHDGNGETLLYRTLALQLKAGHAVYGLQPEMRPDGSFIHTTIPAMAAAHIEKLRSVQPHGPYLLAGLCAGGVISFEMARQLEDAGEQTLFVGIIDAADVKAAERPFLATQARLNRFLATLSDDPTASTAKRLANALPVMARKTVNYVKWEIESRLQKMQTAKKVKSLRDHAPSSEAAAAPAAGEELSLSYLRLYEIAHREHEPRGQFQCGEVALFRASNGDGSEGDIPFMLKYSDPLLGWAPRVKGTVELVPVPGGHSSALQEPNVRVLSVELQRRIDVALAKAEARQASAQAAAPSPDREPATVD
jgi:acyl transferase domain-containing protein/thioesterase domain-containing protein/acyl carrier protein